VFRAACGWPPLFRGESTGCIKEEEVLKVLNSQPTMLTANLSKLDKQHKFKNEILITAMWYIFEILETQLRKRLLP